jgi:hypothetical protein
MLAYRLDDFDFVINSKKTIRKNKRTLSNQRRTKYLVPIFEIFVLNDGDLKNFRLLQVLTKSPLTKLTCAFVVETMRDCAQTFAECIREFFEKLLNVDVVYSKCLYPNLKYHKCNIYKLENISSYEVSFAITKEHVNDNTIEFRQVSEGQKIWVVTNLKTGRLFTFDV